MISQEQALSALNAAERDSESGVLSALEDVSPDDLTAFADTLDKLTETVRNLADGRRGWWSR